MSGQNICRGDDCHRCEYRGMETSMSGPQKKAQDLINLVPGAPIYFVKYHPIPYKKNLRCNTTFQALRHKTHTVNLDKKKPLHVGNSELTAFHNLRKDLG